MNRLSASQKRIFVTLFLSLFATIMGVGIVVPLLPVYAHQLGAGGFTIGMIFGSFSISRTLFVSYFGQKSDQNGRKPFIVSGLFLYGIVSIAFVLTSGVYSLIVIRFFQGVASAMLMPVIQAYIGDMAPSGSEGLSMGVFNMSIFLGLSLGPLMGGLINDFFSLDIAFICMGGLAFLSFGMCMAFLPSTHAERIHGRHASRVSWMALLGDAHILRIFTLRLTYAICVGIIWSFLPVWADSEFHLPSSLIGVLIMLGVLVSGIMHTPMGYLADRQDKRILIGLGAAIVAFALLGFKWATGFWYLFVVNAAVGFGGGIMMPSLLAMAVIRGDQLKVMGAIMGIITFAHSLGMLLGPVFAGSIMEICSLRTVLSTTSIVMIAGTAFFFLPPQSNTQS
jgi:MFS family permease